MADVKWVCGDDTSRDVTRQVMAACAEGLIFVPEAGTEGLARDEARTEPPRIVRVQCTDTQWCDFPCSPPAGISDVVGTPVGSDEVALWKSWRQHADPTKGLERIDKYARWVLTTNNLIVLLAGSLAMTGVIPLQTKWAKYLYAVAIAFLGLSWVAAASSLAPKWLRLNRNSPSDVRTEYNRQYRARRRWLTLAATALGLALATASLVPLGDRVPDRVFSSAGIGYDVKQNGEVTAKLSGAGLPPHTSVDLVLETATPRTTRARTRGLVDSAGKVDVSLTLDSIHAHSAGRPLLVTGRWMVRQGDALVQRQDTSRVP